MFGLILATCIASQNCTFDIVDYNLTESDCNTRMVEYKNERPYEDWDKMPGKHLICDIVEIEAIVPGRGVVSVDSE